MENLEIWALDYYFWSKSSRAPSSDRVRLYLKVSAKGSAVYSALPKLPGCKFFSEIQFECKWKCSATEMSPQLKGDAAALLRLCVQIWLGRKGVAASRVSSAVFFSASSSPRRSGNILGPFIRCRHIMSGIMTKPKKKTMHCTKESGRPFSIFFLLLIRLRVQHPRSSRRVMRSTWLSRRSRSN